jgi:predicted HTH transcriptional regulator
MIKNLEKELDHEFKTQQKVNQAFRKKILKMQSKIRKVRFQRRALVTRMLLRSSVKPTNSLRRLYARNFCGKIYKSAKQIAACYKKATGSAFVKGKSPKPAKGKKTLLAKVIDFF